MPVVEVGVQAKTLCGWVVGKTGVKGQVEEAGEEEADEG